MPACCGKPSPSSYVSYFISYLVTFISYLVTFISYLVTFISYLVTFISFLVTFISYLVTFIFGLLCVSVVDPDPYSEYGSGSTQLKIGKETTANV